MRQFVTQALRHFLLAVQFFTRIPVTGRLAAWVGYSPAMLRASSAHFPAIGWIVGAATAGVFALLWHHLPAHDARSWVAAVLSTAVGVILTGAFHEDGLADTADGLGGGMSRERALEIMKDSRIGTYGAVALVLALLSKISLLVLLAQSGLSWVLAGLWAAHISSRFAPLWLIRSLVHVGDTAQSKSKPLADRITVGALAVGALWWLGGLTLTLCWLPLAAVACGVVGAALATSAMRWQLQRRLQGFTGDGLGATQQLAELGFYLGLCLSLPITLP